MDETGVVVRNKRSRRASADIISSLPPEVIDHILHCLPLKDAIETSSLSTQWRYQWAHRLLQLVLDRQFWNAALPSIYRKETPNELLLKYSSVVSNVLLTHIGPIHKFVLDVPAWIVKDPDISPWIHFLSTKLVREIGLFQRGDGAGNLPTYMFSSAGFNHLSCLEIIDWGLPSLPATFRGFPYLISLKVHTSYETAGQASKLGALVSKCPQLESLDLMIEEDDSLTIHAPKLQDLVVSGVLSGLFLKDTKRIKTVSLKFLLARPWDLMTEFLSRLPLMEKLVLDKCFLWGCIGYVVLPVEKSIFSGKLRELKSIVLDGMRFDTSQFAMSFMLCLFHMTSTLEKLEITVNDVGQAPDNLTIEGDCRLDHLKTAKIIKGFRNDSWTGITLQLIEMILLSAPVFEEMTIEATGLSAEEKSNIATQLLKFSRASTLAKIIF